jgi:putative FmdB family regulatory protein
MPRYTYLCEECDEFFEAIHSMDQIQDCCILCESDRISKTPSKIGDKKAIRTQKVGDIVKDHIKNSREELKRDKMSSKKEFEN